MSEIHEGGCLCGAVRYRVKGNPMRAHVCHCTFCQRRTGSANALVAVFNAANVELTGGPLSSYEHRSDESGRWLRLEFCPRCGTNVTFTFERDSTARSISGGTFDDPGWFKIDRHIWTRSAQKCLSIPPEADRFDQQFIP